MVVHKYRYYLHTRVESGYFFQVQDGFWAGGLCPVLTINFWTIQNLAPVSLGHSKTYGWWAKYWVHPTLLHTYVLLSHFWPYRLALTKAPSFLSRSSMRPFRVRLKLNFSHFLGRYLFLRILNHTCFFLNIVILSKVPLLATL